MDTPFALPGKAIPLQPLLFPQEPSPDRLLYYVRSSGLIGCHISTIFLIPCLTTRADLFSALGSPRPGSSVVERGPEKAGVGGSIPSLATTDDHIFNSRRARCCVRSAIPNQGTKAGASIWNNLQRW